MKPRLLLLTYAAGLLFAPTVQAAPLPSDTKNLGALTLTLQVKSLDQLLDTIKTATKSVLPDALYKGIESTALSRLDPKQLKGIDPKKPFGLYAVLGEGLLQSDFSKSRFVALVPVTNEKDFVDLLATTGMMVEKQGDVYEIPIPNAPVMAASMRFLKGYAHIGIAGQKLDPKLLLDPSDVISAKETAAVVLRIRIDRWPGDLKTVALAGLAQAVDDGKNAPVPPEAKELVNDLLQTLQRWSVRGLEDGKELAVRLDLDPKTATLSVEKSFEAKSGSALAKSFAGLKPTKNDFADLIGADSAAHVLVQAPLFFEDAQSVLGNFVAAASGGALKEMEASNAPKEVRDLIVELFATLGRTIKSGNLDLAASLRGPDKNGQYTAVGAFSFKDTTKIEKLVRDALKVAPKDAGEKIKLDAFKVEGVNVHEIVVGNELPPEAQKIFSKSSVYVALAPNAVFATFGAQARDVMKESLTSKLGPKPAPLLQVEVSGKRLMPLLKSAGLRMDRPEGQFFEKFANTDRVNVWSVKVEGGEKLVVRAEFGFLLPVMSMYWLGMASDKPAAVPPAPPAPAVIEKKAAPPVIEKKKVIDKIEKK